MKQILFFAFLLLHISFTNAQRSTPESQFKKYELGFIDASALKQDIASQRSEVKSFDILGFHLNLVVTDLISPKYKMRVAGSDGIREVKNNLPIAMNGYTSNGGRVSLTINDNYIYGFIQQGEDRINIEPARHYDIESADDQYIIYKSTDVIEKEAACGVDASYKIESLHDDHGHEERNAMVCKDVEIAIASDFSIFQKYGGITGAENHAIGVLNDVQTNYDDEFVAELNFVLVEQFVSNCSTCDPWTNSTEAGVVLDSYTNWAPNGFSNGHDIGSFWTNRDFNGSTIGIAWVGAVCTNFGYNALQDFSSNAQLKRVMVAHEIGHNFDADHDASGSPHIMAPAVQNTTTWSPASKTSIQNYYNSVSCLSACGGGTQAPTAAFDYSIINPCAPGSVSYVNTSTGTVTAWSWTFEGGTPSTSTQQNPSITYANAGVYSITLTVSNNAGQSSTVVYTNEVTINPETAADFDHVINGSVVSFNNTSIYTNPAEFQWDFGDGQGSQSFSPNHTYQNDGTYQVILTVEDVCGISEFEKNIVVATLPQANFIPTTVSGCEGFSTSFINNSSSNTTSILWDFIGGSPLTSTAQNPTVVYNTAGSYDVSLTAFNPQGFNVSTQSALITVHPKPNSNFTHTSANLAFNFTNTSTNAVSYLWTFGDGNTSTNPNPNHTYASPGTYTVTLVATSALCGSNTIAKQVVASALPVASFTTPNNAGCAPFTTTFTSNSSNNPTSYLWSFPNGSPASSLLPNPSVTYTQAGSYNVTLIVSNNFGQDTLTLVNYVQVTTTPLSAFTQSSNGLTYSFTNNSSGAFSQSWDFGDGTQSTAINPTHTYANEGTYNVVLVTTNNCGSNQTSSTITVLLPPAANATATSGIICSNATIEYTDASTGSNTTRQWYFEGGNPQTSTAATQAVSYAATGNYIVRLIKSNAAGSDTFEFVKEVSLIPNPTSNFDAMVTGLDINLSSTSTNATSYLWTLPNGTTNTNSNLIYTVQNNGNYTITLTVTNSCGSDIIVKTISLNSIPVAQYGSSYSTGTVACAPYSVNYSASQGQGYSYLWTFEGGSPASSSELSPVVVYSQEGNFDVSLVITNAFGADTIVSDDYITVKLGPTALYDVATNLGQADFNFTGNNAATYFWDFAGLGTSTLSNPTYTFTANGSYPVTLIVGNQCGNDTLTKVVNIIITSTSDILSELSIYPTPTIDGIWIKGLEKINQSEVEYTIESMSGTVLTKGKLSTDYIDMSQLTTGIYILSLQNKTQPKNKYKILKI